MIYVLRSGHLIKIGFTENLRARLSAIRTASPVEVEFVGHMPGDMALEEHLHNRFAAQHFSGEWYVETDAIRDVFAAILEREIPRIVGEKKQKRVGSDKDVADLASDLRKHSAKRWPETSHGERIELLASTLGWNRSRVKDIYYADPRIAIRFFEREEFARWLTAFRAMARAFDRTGTQG